MPDKNSRRKPSYHKTQITAPSKRYDTGSKFTKGAEIRQRLSFYHWQMAQRSFYLLSRENPKKITKLTLSTQHWIS